MTIKHEGFTPGLWRCMGNIVDIGATPSRAEQSLHLNNPADARLIADAPRLYAENVRLREALDKTCLIVGAGIDCSCTVRQRDSGHHVDCAVPQILAQLEEARAALAGEE